MRYQYEPRILDALADLGLRPTPGTPPQSVKDCVSDLYRYELRKLRDRLLRREIAKAEYSGHVVALRKRYWVLSLPTTLWAK